MFVCVVLSQFIYNRLNNMRPLMHPQLNAFKQLFQTIVSRSGLRVHREQMQSIARREHLLLNIPKI